MPIKSQTTTTEAALMEKTQITPNPGSEAAIAQGCKCPVLDNAHGRGRHGGKFWINLDCPIHVIQAGRRI